MVSVESHPGLSVGTVTKMLSEDDKKRLSEIMDELRCIYEAESVGLYIKDQYLNGCDIAIDITRSTLGETWHK